MIAWDPPEFDGGSKIFAYQVEKSLGGSMFVSGGYLTEIDKTEYKVNRLYEGNEYLFRIAAENKIGLGDTCTLDKLVKAKLPFGKNISYLM